MGFSLEIELSKYSEILLRERPEKFHMASKISINSIIRNKREKMEKNSQSMNRDKGPSLNTRYM